MLAQLGHHLGDALALVGRGLVDVVEPVAIQQVGVAAPGEDGLALGVVLGEVVLRQLDGQPGVEVAPVLVGQGVATVLKVAEGVDLVEVTRGDEGRTARGAAGKHLQRGVGLDLALVGHGVAAVRHVVDLVKAVGEEVVLVAQALREHAEDLAAEDALVHAVEVVEAGKGAPAEEHRGKHVLRGPIHDFAELVPVVHVLKGHLLDGRAGDDEAVVVVDLEGLEGVVELHQVVGGVRGLVGGDAHEVHAHLQRRLGDEAQDLRLGLDLGGHEVEQADVERANLLLAGHVFLKREDALLLQNALGGQAVGNVDGHWGGAFLRPDARQMKPGAGHGAGRSAAGEGTCSS